MRPFAKSYQCRPISSTGQSHLENGDKIILPASALTSLTSKNAEYPLLFQLTNRSQRKVTHCGVMEFSAEEGTVLVPGWIMRNLKLREGDVVGVKKASLKKATFVRLRPHEAAFLELSNPKAVLEKILRGFTCLTAGDTIVIDYNDKKYSIDVLQTKPDQQAVSIVEADVVVDFARPKDYKEPEKPIMAEAEAEAEKVEEKEGGGGGGGGFQAFSGRSYKLSG